MNQRLFLGSVGYLAVVVAIGFLGVPGAAPVAEGRSGADVAGERILEAAKAYIEGLPDGKREKVVTSFDSEERFDWHFIPRSRPGLALKDHSKEEKKALWTLLDASLSKAGARQARQVIRLEGILRDIEGAGGTLSRDPGLYHVRFFSTPSGEESWGYRFEGHHLSLHYTLEGGTLVAATPCFYGANPSVVPEGPHKGLQVLAGVEDTARALVTSLDTDQLARCRGSEDVPREVPETRKREYKGPFPEGVTLDGLTDGQRTTFRKLIREYTAKLPEEFARHVEKQVSGEKPADIHFAWRGGLKPFEPHSYMVHGKTFVINYSNVQGGGRHVHSALRERGADFGRSR